MRLFFFAWFVLGTSASDPVLDAIQELSKQMNFMDRRIEARLFSVSDRIACVETKIDVIEDRMKTLETAVEGRMKAVEDRMISLETSVEGRMKSLETAVEGRMKTLEGSLKEQVEVINMQLISSHDFNANCVEVMESVTSKVGGGIATALSFGGFVYEIFPLHVITPEEIIIRYEPHGYDVICHPMYDICVAPACPSTAALKIESFSRPRLADKVIGVGKGVVGVAWEGMIVGLIDGNECMKSDQGNTKLCPNEWYVRGGQHEGQSGAIVVNSCGFVGIAHAVTTASASQYANAAFVISAEEIIHLAGKLSRRKSVHSCPGLRLLDMPLSPVANCTRFLHPIKQARGHFNLSEVALPYSQR